MWSVITWIRSCYRVATNFQQQISRFNSRILSWLLRMVKVKLLVKTVRKCRIAGLSWTTSMQYNTLNAEFKELNGHFKILGLDGRNGESANAKRGGMDFFHIPLPTLQCKRSHMTPTFLLDIFLQHSLQTVLHFFCCHIFPHTVHHFLYRRFWYCRAVHCPFF